MGLIRGLAAYSVAVVASCCWAAAADQMITVGGQPIPIQAQVAAAPAPASSNWIALRGGNSIKFLGAGEIKIAQPVGAKSIYANFALKDYALHKQPAKLIEAADEIFGRFVIVTADQSGFTRVTVNLQKGQVKNGAVTTPVFEDFVYVRGQNTVWLRQAGKQPWKVAQSTVYEPQPALVRTVDGIGRIEIEATAEIFPPAGARRAVGIDIRTDTPNKNQLQKYKEIRAVWLEVDRAALLQMGVDHVAIQNFTSKRLGRFQVRQMAYVQIQREAGKGWPDMPAAPPTNGKSKPSLTAEVPTINPEFLTAAIGRAFQLQPGGLSDPLASAVAQIEIGETEGFAALLQSDEQMQGRVFKASLKSNE